MRRRLGVFVAVLVALVAWVLLVGAGARHGWWRATPAAEGDGPGFLRWAESRHAAASKGNFAMALLEGGEVAGTSFASRGRAVDGDSLFQVASLSKWITAWGVMTLVEQGRVDLDAPVSRCLTRWRLPPSEFDADAVTVRRLLSHAAGLTDGLGFRGYAPGEALPSIEEELTRPGDVLPGASGVVRVGARPGTTWRYSGGGYLILQLLIEEVSGEPFEAFMRRSVLLPLGMTSSTFVDPDPARLADFYDADGSEAIRYRFTALGAASLYTSVADMARFLAAHVAGPDGAPPGRGVLTPATLEAMRTPHSFLYGVPVWGLGATLYVPNGAGGYVIGHDGNNHPALNTTARVDPATGDGVVVLESGHGALAREIGGEWVFWRTGIVGLDTLVLFDAQGILIRLASGALVISIAGLLLARRASRRTPSPP